MASERECSNCKTLQRVKLQLSQAEDREREFREKLRDAKLDLANKERQLEVAKRMLSKVASEKSQIEVAAEHDKAASRKLEHRLAVAEGGEGLQAKVAKYKAQLLDLRELQRDTESSLMVSEEARVNLAREVHVLKAALGLKTDMPDAHLDSHGRMLHALAQSQEESSSLALALADKESALSEGAAALRQAKNEVERLLGLRVNLIRETDEARQEAGEALELASVYRREVAAAKQEVEHLREQVQQVLLSQSRTEGLLRSTEAALTAQQEKGRQLQDKVNQLERAGRLSAEALHTEVTQALERADVRHAELRAESTAKQAQLTEQLTQLTRALEAEKASHVSDQRLHDAELSEHVAVISCLQAGREEAEGEAAEARQELMEVRRRCEKMEEMCEKLKSEVRVSEEVSRRARDEAVTACDQLSVERREASTLRARIEGVEGRLKALVAAGGEREDELKEEISRLNAELSATSMIQSQLQQELTATRNQAVDAVDHCAHADHQVEELHSTIHSLTQSKAKLQSGLFDQLGVFRDKLALVEEENRQLRLALGMMGERLQPQPKTTVAGGTAQVDKVLQHAVTAASAAAAAARISGIRSPTAVGRNPNLGPLERTSPHGTSSLLGRARDRSRALGCEDSEDEEENEQKPRVGSGLAAAWRTRGSSGVSADLGGGVVLGGRGAAGSVPSPLMSRSAMSHLQAALKRQPR